MRRGEITGQTFDFTKENIGMPFRSTSIMRKKEVKSQSVIDNMLSSQEEQTSDQHNFQYFDPNSSLYATDVSTTEQINPLIVDDRIDFDRKHRNNILPSIERISEANIQNMNSQTSDYLNVISCNIFNDIAKQTIINFCICPIGGLSNLIKNDPNINKIMSFINCGEIFHQSKIVNNTIISRASIQYNNSPKILTSNFTHYEDNMNNVIEFPFINKAFSIGFICNKQGEMPLLTLKNLNGYIANLKHSKNNIYCPSFKVSNQINLNPTLSRMGYIKDNSLNYLQTIYFEITNNIYVKTTTMSNTINLSDNFIFYIRYVPNNIILFIGRHGSI